MEGLKWFYEMLVTSGADPYHVSIAVCVVGVLGIYIVARSIMHLINGR